MGICCFSGMVFVNSSGTGCINRRDWSETGVIFHVHPGTEQGFLVANLEQDINLE